MKHSHLPFTFLLCFMLGVSFVIPIFTKNTVLGDTPSIPSPATSGFILDAYDTTKINVSVNQSHFRFWNEYVNESLEHFDVFVPEYLNDSLDLITPCDPNIMVCQGPNGYFHVLNDWTNEYSDRFYIETDYIYDRFYTDDKVPDGFSNVRINQNITVNYTGQNNSGIGDLLNTVVDIDDSHSIRINVSSTEYNLILNYTYYYNDNITGSFEDTYGDYVPDDISEIINFKSDDNRLNVSLQRNNPTVQFYKNDDAFFNVSYNITDTENISIDLSNNSFYQHYDDKDFVFYPVNDSGKPSFEYGLNLKSMPSSNELFLILNMMD